MPRSASKPAKVLKTTTVSKVNARAAKPAPVKSVSSSNKKTTRPQAKSAAAPLVETVTLNVVVPTKTRDGLAAVKTALKMSNQGEVISWLVKTALKQLRAKG